MDIGWQQQNLSSDMLLHIHPKYSDRQVYASSLRPRSDTAESAWAGSTLSAQVCQSEYLGKNRYFIN